MENDVILTVICITYNQEKFIRDALDSFLMQKTKYKFQVYIHDDASTDKTKEIIMSYAQKYPNYIIPFFEEENVHSKGLKVLTDIMFPKIKTKYFCICEGDDYWTDESRIENTISFLEKNDEYDAVTHRVKYYDYSNKMDIGFSNESLVEHNYSLVEGILLKSHTTGWVFRTDFYKKEVDKKFVFLKSLTHYKMSLFASFCGKTRYLPECYSIWRRGIPGSWTNRNINGDKNQKINFYNRHIKFLKKINHITPFNAKYYSFCKLQNDKIEKYTFLNKKMLVFFAKVKRKIVGNFLKMFVRS